MRSRKSTIKILKENLIKWKTFIVMSWQQDVVIGQGWVMPKYKTVFEGK
jgi:hypothetical protein